MGKVSIIIRTYNRLEYLMQTLYSIEKSKYKNYEVIIVNNNSQDGTKEWLSWMKENSGVAVIKNTTVVNSDVNH